MYFGLIGRGANILDWFDDEEAARGALYALVEEDPALAEDAALLPFEDNGDPAGEPIKVSTTRVVTTATRWLTPWSSRESTYKGPLTAAKTKDPFAAA